MTDGEIHDV